MPHVMCFGATPRPPHHTHTHRSSDRPHIGTLAHWPHRRYTAILSALWLSLRPRAVPPCRAGLAPGTVEPWYRGTAMRTNLANLTAVLRMRHTIAIFIRTSRPSASQPSSSPTSLTAHPLTQHHRIRYPVHSGRALDTRQSHQLSSATPPPHPPPALVAGTTHYRLACIG